MIIQHNLSSLNTSNKLKINIKKSASSIEKLSSGLRINRAADDAAGLAISEKMRAQIRGLSQAQRNVQDGISLIQTAEGGLAEMHSHLQRMRELSVQAANGTLQDNDRQMVQYEIDQLKQGIDSIANNTEFNAMKLLDGSKSITGGALTSVTITAPQILVYTFTGSDWHEGFGFWNPITNAGAYFDLCENPNSSPWIGVQIEPTLEETLSNLVEKFNSTKSGVGYYANSLQGVNIGIFGNNVVFTSNTCMRLSDVLGIYSGTTQTYEGSPASVVLNYNSLITDSTIKLQVGANAGQTLQMSISDMRTTSLGIDNVNVTTQMGADQAISLIDTAISKASSERSKMGAYQNKLEHIGKNLSNYEENITASESRIRDVDMATEMMNFTMSNILIQAAEAMLAQANQEPQSILQLLK